MAKPNPSDSGAYGKKISERSDSYFNHSISERSDSYFNHSDKPQGPGNYDTRKVREEAVKNHPSENTGYRSATPGEGYSGSNPELKVGRSPLAREYLSKAEGDLEDRAKSLGLDYSSKDLDRIEQAVEGARNTAANREEIYVRSVHRKKGSSPQNVYITKTTAGLGERVSALHERMEANKWDNYEGPKSRNEYEDASNSLGPTRKVSLPAGSVTEGDRLSPDKLEGLKKEAEDINYGLRMKRGFGKLGEVFKNMFSPKKDSYSAKSGADNTEIIDEHKKMLGERNKAIGKILSEAQKVNTVPGEPAATITPIREAAEREAERYRRETKPGDEEATGLRNSSHSGEENYGNPGKVMSGHKDVGMYFQGEPDHSHLKKPGLTSDTGSKEPVKPADWRSILGFEGISSKDTSETESSEAYGNPGAVGPRTSKSVHMMYEVEGPETGPKGPTSSGGSGATSQSKALKEMYEKRLADKNKEGSIENSGLPAVKGSGGDPIRYSAKVAKEVERRIKDNGGTSQAIPLGDGGHTKTLGGYSVHENLVDVSEPYQGDNPERDMEEDVNLRKVLKREERYGREVPEGESFLGEEEPVQAKDTTYRGLGVGRKEVYRENTGLEGGLAYAHNKDTAFDPYTNIGERIKSLKGDIERYESTMEAKGSNEVIQGLKKGHERELARLGEVLSERYQNLTQAWDRAEGDSSVRGGLMKDISALKPLLEELSYEVRLPWQESERESSGDEAGQSGARA
jgi:hypothetical protein